MAETDIAASQQYDLFTVLGARRLVLKLRDRGITLSADRLVWQTEGGELWANLAEISGIRMQLGQVAREPIGSCIISFRKGAPLNVTSANSWGKGDDDRARIYSRFVDDLHGRLAAMPPGSIEFAAGATQRQQTMGVVATAVAALLFFCLPLGLLLVTGNAEALAPLIGGAIFVYPLFRVLQKNKPRSYDPQAIPEELLP